MWFLNRYDTNQAVQAQMARSWKFWIKEVEELYYPCSENKGADELRSYCEADLRLFFRISKFWSSHDVTTNEPPHGKTNNLHMRKQRRKSASR